MEGGGGAVRVEEWGVEQGGRRRRLKTEAGRWISSRSERDAEVQNRLHVVMKRLMSVM